VLSIDHLIYFWFTLLLFLDEICLDKLKWRYGKIIIATDSFKGSLSASEACRIIAGQAERVFPQAKIVQLPISDGGEGLVEVILNALGGEHRIMHTSDPLGREISASYLQLADGSALIEMAGAGGLTLLDPGEYDPLRASTFGVGLMILHAVRNGLDPIYIGLGGSATVDGGTGAATAFGMCFLDEMGEKVTSGGGLRKVQRLDLSGLRELNYSGKLIFLTDVNNPLCGPNGAAEVFGPQKGATAEQVWQLDQGLRNLAELLERETGLNLQDVPGMGAAGGFALPFVALLALLSLGVKKIRLGPTLPAFLSPNVAKVIVEAFDLKPIDTVEADVAAMMAGA